MRKALILIAVFLLLPVTTYSLLPNYLLQNELQADPADLQTPDGANILYQAGPMPLFGDCVPEPATVCLLALSSLMLFNRKIRTPHREIY